MRQLEGSEGVGGEASKKGQGKAKKEWGGGHEASKKYGVGGSKQEMRGGGGSKWKGKAEDSGENSHPRI